MPADIAAKDGADVFYKFERNPMANALGLDVPDADVGINKGPLSERRILELEDATALPAWASPALRGLRRSRTPGGCGVARLAQQLLAGGPVLVCLHRLGSILDESKR